MILKDIRIDDLKTVIDFIYRGEVNVAQDRLQDVLRVSKVTGRLQCRWLFMVYVRMSMFILGFMNEILLLFAFKKEIYGFYCVLGRIIEN